MLLITNKLHPYNKPSPTKLANAPAIASQQALSN